MGMPNIVFRCQMFRGDWDQIWSQMRMLWLMEGLVRVNQTHLRRMRPSIFGLQYSKSSYLIRHRRVQSVRPDLCPIPRVS